MNPHNFTRLVALPTIVLALGLALIAVMKDISNTPDPTGITSPPVFENDPIVLEDVEGEEHAFADPCGLEAVICENER